MRLAEAIERGELTGGSSSKKCKALAWCARLLALSEAGDKADEILCTSKQLGSNEEITIAEAFRIAAKGDLEKALNNLSNLKSPNSVSAAFLIVNNTKGAASAFDWMMHSGLDHQNLDPDGKFVFITRLLEIGHWDEAIKSVKDMEDDDFQAAPVLLHVAGISHLMKSVPDELKSSVLRRVPIDASTFPLASDESSLIDRRKARDYFNRYAKAARELGCIDVANVADDFSLWLPTGTDECLCHQPAQAGVSGRVAWRSWRSTCFDFQVALLNGGSHSQGCNKNKVPDTFTLKSVDILSLLASS